MVKFVSVIQIEVNKVNIIFNIIRHKKLRYEIKTHRVTIKAKFKLNCDILTLYDPGGGGGFKSAPSDFLFSRI